MNKSSGIPWIIAGYAILALNTLMSDKSWSPKTAISAGIAALGVGAMGNTIMSLRFGQLYFLAVCLTHGLELVENIGDAPEKLPSFNSGGTGTGTKKNNIDGLDSTDSGGGDSDDSRGGNGDDPGTNGGGTKSPYINPRNV